MPDESITVDAVVVGAGPAGSAAALELAKAGRDVVIVERGAFPGAKNVYGGVVYATDPRRRSCRSGGPRCRYSGG